MMRPENHVRVFTDITGEMYWSKEMLSSKKHSLIRLMNRLIFPVRRFFLLET